MIRSKIIFALFCWLIFSGNAFAVERPNVLLIMVDDLRVELGCYGQQHVLSPHIDRLAERGTLFERAYCQQAVCNPSRASMLTGLRPETLNIWDLPTHFRERLPDVVTLPQFLKDHGYMAQNVGKIFHNFRQDRYKGDPVSWSLPAVMHYNSHGNDTPIVTGPLPADLLNLPRAEMREVPDEAYFDGRIANLAIEALQQWKEQPFFLAVGFWKPHLPFNAPKKYWDLYDRQAIQAPENPHPPQQVPAIALHDSRELLRGYKDRPDGKPTPEEVLALRHGYYAAISYVDAQIGKVLDELERLELTQKTLVVFCSDHGFHLGEHDLWAKTSNFELDARVPMIIATPGQSQSQRTSSLVELLDLYPTIVELCELEPPIQLEGRSLAPILKQPETSVKSAAYTWHPRPAYPRPGQDPDVMGHSIRTTRYRYTEWRDFQTGVVQARELYDHYSDPQETVNLVNQEQQSTIERLSRQLQLKTVSPQEGPLQPYLGEARFEMQQVFEQQRFPNVVVTQKGTVLVSFGNESVRIRRSEDGGQSWGVPITVAETGFHGGGTTVDEVTGDLLVFVEEQHPPAPLTIYRSRNDGKTWSADSKTTILPDSDGRRPSMHMNEHGITLRHGEHAGRLIRASRYYAGKNERSRWPDHFTNAIYSDDGGQSWQTSEPFPENGTGEAAIVELSDGRLYYNSRIHWDERPQNTRRRSAISSDGGHTWQDWDVVEILPDGHQHRSYGCMGGLTRLPVAGRDLLIFSNIDTDNPQRERATVWASFDGGQTWPVKRLVYEGPSAYSSLSSGRPGTDSEGWIYLHFEGGPQGGSTVARFNLAWLLQGEATGDGQIPGWVIGQE